MYEENNITDEFQENPEEEKSDIELVREKYENQRSQKADEIIAIQAVICIILVIGFFIANMFYPEICRELYSILENFVKNTEITVPYISDYV